MKRLVWDESLKSALSKLIPPLSFSMHKGSSCRLAVVGGSVEYHGAAYFAGESGLKMGGDLCRIFCDSSAAIPIKCLSPELMVTPIFDVSNNKTFNDSSSSSSSPTSGSGADSVKNAFPQLHSIVVGPGLSRDPIALDAAKQIVTSAVQDGKPVVIDADGLYMLCQNDNLEIIRSSPHAILTPNAVEFKRLVAAARILPPLLQHTNPFDIFDDIVIGSTDVISGTHDVDIGVGVDIGVDIGVGESKSKTDKKKRIVTAKEYDPLLLEALCTHLGNITILLKGAQDLISAGNGVFQIAEKGSPRRCGGQGDLLAGTTAVAAHWSSSMLVPKPSSSLSSIATRTGLLNEIYPNSILPSTVWACVISSILVRRAAVMAFEEKKRATSSNDILQYIGEAFEDMFPFSDDVAK